MYVVHANLVAILTPSQPSASRYNDSRERNRFCIEDPFEADFNVARCVTKDGLYTVRTLFQAFFTFPHVFGRYEESSCAQCVSLLLGRNVLS